MNVSVFYSFPQELAPLRRQVCAVPATASPCKTLQATYRSHGLTFFEAGMGQKAAGKALLHQMAGQKPDLVISAGFCGALAQGIPIGTVVLATDVILCNGMGVVDSLAIPLVIDCELIHAPIKPGRMVTLEQRMEKQAVREFVSGTPTLTVCDMESYYLAKNSLGLGALFIALRSVSDSAPTDIPCALFDVCDAVSGAYSPIRAVSVLLTNPRLIPGTLALGFHARTAAWRLSQAVIALLNVLP